ncbi:MAG: hypothetical protein BGN88_10260 [Clostridiales bacterium 43-6]|nr:MAG: hypothetical protein BGN88_10260 [Clostridiales bacterium 43-6]
METIEREENVIRNIYEGNIDFANRTFEKGSEYAENIHEFCRLEEEVYQLLGEHNKTKAEELISSILSLEYLVECDSFAEGFKMGTRMLMAALYDVNAKSIYKK